MQVKFKKLHPSAVLPYYSQLGDAGLDLTAVTKEYDNEKDLIVMDTGIAVEIPNGYTGLVFPRSSICKTKLSLANSVGIIDSGYRGSIKFMFRPMDRPTKNYEVGDRIGQLVILPYPYIEPVLSEELSETNRGSGFGSSGK